MLTNCHHGIIVLVGLAVKASSNTLVRLRSSARELFVREGYHNTRPQDIAKHAGVANGTFYLHFKDKKAAFLDFAQQAQTELVDCLKVNLDGVEGHRERWRVLFNTLIRFGTEHSGLLNAAFLDPVLIAPDDDDAWQMYDGLGKFVSLAIKQKYDGVAVVAEYNLELISHGICGMLRHALTYAVRKELDFEKLADDLSLFIDRGLGLET